MKFELIKYVVEKNEKKYTNYYLFSDELQMKFAIKPVVYKSEEGIVTNGATLNVFSKIAKLCED